MDRNEQIERIKQYEARLEEAERLLRRGDAAPQAIARLRELTQVLEAYYTSEAWKRDFADDAAGLLPAELKRGVLSEDGIWNVLEAAKELQAEQGTCDPAGGAGAQEEAGFGVLTQESVAGRRCVIKAAAAPKALLLQPVGAQEAAGLGQQLQIIRELSDVPFLFAGFAVEDWNRALSPWQAPPVFGKEGFGAGAQDTLLYVTQTLLPTLHARYGLPEALPVILGGYSLAALFCLWSACQTERFFGIAAASPPVWFPGWMDFAKTHTPQARCVYLSLGDREARAKNPVLATVGDRIRAQAALLQNTPGCSSTLEWNAGNHFQEPARRCAKGFAWCLQQLCRPGEAGGRDLPRQGTKHTNPLGHRIP